MHRTRTHTHTHTHTCTRAHTHTHTHVHRTHTPQYTHHIDTHTHTCTRTHTRVHRTRPVDACQWTMPSHGAHPTTPALAQLQAACAYLEQERSLNERLGQQNTALMSVNERQKAHMEELQRSVAQLTVSPRTLAHTDDSKLFCMVKELTSCSKMGV